MNSSHTPWRRLWNFISGNSCGWLLLSILLIPLLQLAGNMCGRELILYHPEWEHELCAAAAVLWAVLACISRRRINRAGRICAYLCPPAAMIFSTAAVLLRGECPADVISVIIVCIASLCVFVCCTGGKMLKKSIGILCAVLSAAAFFFFDSFTVPLLLIGLCLCAIYFLKDSRAQTAAALMYGLLFCISAVFIAAAGVFVVLDVQAVVTSSEKIPSPDGTQSAQLFHVDEGALGCSQYMQVEESGEGINVLIGRLKNSRRIDLENYTHIYDSEKDELLLLRWSDNSTLLIGGDRVLLDQTIQQISFTPYVDVITRSDEDGSLHYYGIGREYTSKLYRQRRAIEPFVADAAQEYLLSEHLQSDDKEFWTQEQIKKWSINDRLWNPVINLAEHEGEYVSQDAVMQRISVLIGQQAEHDVMNVKIFRVNGVYFARTMLNVNLWTPYELYFYHPALDRLIFLDKFADEEIMGLKIHQEEFRKDWIEAFTYAQEGA